MQKLAYDQPSIAWREYSDQSQFGLALIRFLPLSVGDAVEI